MASSLLSPEQRAVFARVILEPFRRIVRVNDAAAGSQQALTQADPNGRKGAGIEIVTASLVPKHDVMPAPAVADAVHFVLFWPS
jgi:hypothetical protein